MIILQYKVNIDSYSMCDQARSGEEAISLIEMDLKRNNYKKTSYNVIFMDCNMPEMDGYEATHKIRTMFYKHNISQPLISAITGHSEQKYVNRCITSGMNQVLSKPVDGAILKALIEKINFMFWAYLIKLFNLIKIIGNFYLKLEFIF